MMRTSVFPSTPAKIHRSRGIRTRLLDRFVADARSMKVVDHDLVATVTALTARSIADACRRFIFPRGRVDQLIVTGGGAKNPTLMRMIAAELPDVEVITAEEVGVDGDALEAVAFAILGYQMLRGRQGNIPSVTGARAPAILGKLTLPPAPMTKVQGLPLPKEA